jgi:hypothetical protein
MSVTATTNAFNCRVQNETTSSISYPKTLLKVAKLPFNFFKAKSTESSYQWSSSNLSDGAGLTKTVSCPCELGDFVLFGWASNLSGISTACYVSSSNTIACRLQNETGSALAVVTATADLNVYVLDESKADCRGASVYNPPSLSDADGVTVDVTCLGARVGDFAVASFSLDLQGILLSALVSANNIVSVRLQNETGGTLDLGSGIIRVIVFKA